MKADAGTRLEPASMLETAPLPERSSPLRHPKVDGSDSPRHSRKSFTLPLRGSIESPTNRWSKFSTENASMKTDGSRRSSSGSLHAERIFLLEAKKFARNEFRRSSYSVNLNTLMTDGKMDDLKLSMISFDGLDEDVELEEESTQQLRESGTKVVRFNLVEIREHPIIVGQNPGGTLGVPVTVAWDHVNSYSIPIDPYESARESNRRPMKYLRMNKSHREMLLKDLGFSLQERAEGNRVANIIRRQRKQTNAHIHRDMVHEKLEKMTRALKNAATLGRKKAMERRFISRSYHSGVSLMDNSVSSILSTSSEPPTPLSMSHGTA